MACDDSEDGEELNNESARPSYEEYNRALQNDRDDEDEAQESERDDLGDDFDDFEEGGPADDFGEFGDGVQEPAVAGGLKRPEPPDPPPRLPKCPFVSRTCVVMQLYSSAMVLSVTTQDVS